MDDRELLNRIERHLERGNEVIDRNTASMERNSAAMDRNTQVIGGLQHFAQDLIGRFDAVAKAIDGAMREQAAAMRGQASAMEDLGDQAKAHERTLMFILDELKAIRRADGTS